MTESVKSMKHNPQFVMDLASKERSKTHARNTRNSFQNPTQSTELLSRDHAGIVLRRPACFKVQQNQAGFYKSSNCPCPRPGTAHTPGRNTA